MVLSYKLIFIGMGIWARWRHLGATCCIALAKKGGIKAKRSIVYAVCMKGGVWEVLRSLCGGLVAILFRRYSHN